MAKAQVKASTQNLLDLTSSYVQRIFAIQPLDTLILSVVHLRGIMRCNIDEQGPTSRRKTLPTGTFETVGQVEYEVLAG